MSPPADGVHSTDVLLGEILARMTAVESRQQEQGRDVREARDLAKGIAAIMGEQQIGEQIERLRSDIKSNAGELRSDMVNAASRLETKLGDRIDANRDALGEESDERRKLEERVKKLEKAGDQMDGARSLVNWLLKYAPILLSAGAFIASVFGLKDRIGH